MLESISRLSEKSVGPSVPITARAPRFKNKGKRKRLYLLPYFGPRATRQPYWRLPRYWWSDPSLMGSLMMISPLRILMLYRHDGFVQTQALYSIEAPWLPKSESGTRSPSLHLRHRGNAFSTKSPPSFSLEDCIRRLIKMR